jgi:hypothetical protein
LLGSTARYKIGLDYANRPIIGIGITGDLAKNPVVSINIGENDRWPKFACGIIGKGEPDKHNASY